MPTSIPGIIFQVTSSDNCGGTQTPRIMVGMNVHAVMISRTSGRGRSRLASLNPAGNKAKMKYIIAKVPAGIVDTSSIGLFQKSTQQKIANGNEIVSKTTFSPSRRLSCMSLRAKIRAMARNRDKPNIPIRIVRYWEGLGAGPVINVSGITQ